MGIIFLTWHCFPSHRRVWQATQDEQNAHFILLSAFATPPTFTICSFKMCRLTLFWKLQRHLLSSSTLFYFPLRAVILDPRNSRFKAYCQKASDVVVGLGLGFSTHCRMLGFFCTTLLSYHPEQCAQP